MQPKLSVVVAVYNAEKELERCVDSILGQTFTDYELILVDDGSSDQTPIICDRYAEKDNRVKVIHQVNAGCVKARKVGLLQSAGDYISYIDADDWIDDTMYEQMISCGQDADVIIGGIIVEMDGNVQRIPCNMPSGIYEGDDLNKFYETFIFTGKYFETGVMDSLCTKIFRRELLLNVQINAPETVRIGEDSIITYPALLKADKIAVLDLLAYHNIREGQTMSNTFDDKEFERFEDMYKWLRTQFRDHDQIMLKQFPYQMFYIIWTGVQLELNHDGKIRHFFYKRNRLEKLLAKEWIIETLSKTEQEILPKDLWSFRQHVVKGSIKEWVVKYYFQCMLKKIGRIVRRR